jgi:hypothetical protein
MLFGNSLVILLLNLTLKSCRSISDLNPVLQDLWSFCTLPLPNLSLYFYQSSRDVRAENFLNETMFLQTRELNLSFNMSLQDVRLSGVRVFLSVFFFF